MKNRIINSVNDSLIATAQLKEPVSINFISEVASTMANCFRNQGKIIIAGNGGSLCDASHFAEELTGLFRAFRPALPAIALSDPGHITCVGNDLGFDQIFSRGVEAYGNKNDIFIGLTTSGNSLNIVNAFNAAKKKGLTTVAFLGKCGGKLKGIADYELLITGMATSDRIQEAHMTAIHIIIELVENLLFPNTSSHLNGQIENDPILQYGVPLVQPV
ncbi:MAG: SIS domain-containing protein [Parachlamydiaceae bacterium]|nr:SIS domain-containing protein [Parachlamydiaceae bacterium]